MSKSKGEIVTSFKIDLNKKQIRVIENQWQRHGKLGRATVSQARWGMGWSKAYMKITILNEEAAEKIANVIDTFNKIPDSPK